METRVMIKISRAKEKTIFLGPGDGRTRILIASEDGAVNLSMGHMRFPAGGKTDTHVRETEEVIYIIKGRSAIITKTGRYELEAGDAIHISPGTEHYHENIGSEEMEHIWIFAPQGPEETIRKLPAE